MTLAEELRRIGFVVTPAQLRWLESDSATELRREGERIGKRLQAGIHALRRAGEQYGKALAVEIASAAAASQRK